MTNRSPYFRQYASEVLLALLPFNEQQQLFVRVLRDWCWLKARGGPWKVSARELALLVRVPQDAIHALASEVAACSVLEIVAEGDSLVITAPDLAEQALAMERERTKKQTQRGQDRDTSRDNAGTRPGTAKGRAPGPRRDAARDSVGTPLSIDRGIDRSNDRREIEREIDRSAARGGGPAGQEPSAAAPAPALPEYARVGPELERQLGRAPTLGEIAEHALGHPLAAAVGPPREPTKPALPARRGRPSANGHAAAAPRAGFGADPGVLDVAGGG